MKFLEILKTAKKVASDGRQGLWRKDYLCWVKDNWLARGKPLDFDKYKYLVDIYKDQHKEIVFQKPAQTGITERMITEAMWIADQKPVNALYFFPTTASIGDMVQERVDQPLNSSDYLRSVNRMSKDSLGKRVDKVGLKKMTLGFVYFRGSNSYAQITSVPGDVIFVDELDRMTQENVPYFDKRLGNSKLKWKRWCSTPTYPDFGINKKYKESDQREYFVKCNHCGEEQTLTFWDNVNKENGDVICSSCGKKIIPWELEGEWKPTKPENSEIHGYYISPLLSPMVNVKDLIKQAAASSDSDLQQFYNQNLGLPYEPKGDKLNDSLIMNCVGEHRMPAYDDYAFMGVDVGKVLHYVVRTSNKVLEVGRVKDFLGEEGSLESLIKKHKIKSLVIDALPETRKVQELINKYKGIVKMCYYSGGVPKDSTKYWKLDKDTVTTDRTVALDSMVAEYRDKKIQVPVNIRDDKEFLSHMTSSIRIIKEKENGDKRAEWIETSADHLFHASQYAKLAKEIGTNLEPEIFWI
ncbi:MAG: phage terminase large subunit family protein [Novosphingobium sp.]|nr:phage terminase large subunit family protein [Novosphingobium sp.]